ncbi:MAG: tRNA guanosine(34) transglycosylase Tgt [Nanoarchaeota archaeon]|nr:tRNA guanosine(34) transglycosylase Tgt [Nanoarchaeota archaeon]
MPKKNSPIQFQILAKDKKSRARAGIIHTRNGIIETPYLIPVATKGEIKSLSPADIKKINPQALLANTYHLHFNPGDKKIKKIGGLHKFMHFSKPIFTDSGGFQAFSLGEAKLFGVNKLGKNKEKITSEKVSLLTKITEKGVSFKSIYDNKWYFLDAKKSMQIQSNLGSDIIMAFDECTAANKSISQQGKSLERTNKWALQSLKYHDKNQALYGIIQGGQFKKLRLKSTKFISKLPFDGIAIGGSFGTSYGDSKKSMNQILKWIMQELQKNQESYNKPRHMLGIGWIDDLFNCIEQGIDTFDCVEMTRIARHGNLYISPKSGGSLKNKFRLNIQKTKFESDKKPIDPLCTCPTCKKYSRSEIRKIYKKMTQNKQDEKTKNKYGKLATTHNIHFMLNLVKQIRESIKANTFHKLKKQWLKN